MGITVDSATQAHLDLPVTDLAMCMKVTRTDGKVFTFTNHDQHINLKGDIYLSGLTLDQTAIADAIDMSVDNLEIDGLIDGSLFDIQELRVGLYDYAAIEMFIVVWSDLSLPIIKKRAGWFGQVRTSTVQVFMAEVRGLFANLQQTIGELYSAGCRADLGDTRCKIPTYPDEIQRSTAVSRNEYYRVPTSYSVGQVVALDVVNADFEDNTLAGWTVDYGAPISSNAVGIDPYSGSRYLRGTEGAYDFQVSQIIDISSYATAVDAGNVELFFRVHTGWMINDVDDIRRMHVDALDTSQVFINHIYDSGDETQGTELDDRYYLRGGFNLAVPANTRYVRIVLRGDAVTDDTPRCVFDNVSLELLDTTNPRERCFNVGWNTDFEVGDGTDWTVPIGTFSVDNSDSGTTPNSGQWFFQSKGEARTVIQYDYALTDLEIDLLNDVDNGLFDVQLTYYVTINVAGETDTVKVTLSAYNAVGDLLKNEYGFEFLYQQEWGDADLTDDVWTERIKRVKIPENTRTLRIECDFVRNNGTNNNVCLDDIQLDILRNETTQGSEIYENRIYRVSKPGTTATGQPAYNTSVGSRTADGTAELTAVEAWTRHGVVATVIDRKTITATITESRSVDDWFTGGILTWESGANNGRTVEIVDYVHSTTTVTLFIDMNYDIQVGDKFRIQAGCDKFYNTCRDKFSNTDNFRGEPYLTGADNFHNYRIPPRR